MASCQGKRGALYQGCKPQMTNAASWLPATGMCRLHFLSAAIHGKAVPQVSELTDSARPDVAAWAVADSARPDVAALSVADPSMGRHVSIQHSQQAVKVIVITRIEWYQADVVWCTNARVPCC
jgi:hypothetical protein